MLSAIQRVQIKNCQAENQFTSYPLDLLGVERKNFPVLRRFTTRGIKRFSSKIKRDSYHPCPLLPVWQRSNISVVWKNEICFLHFLESLHSNVLAHSAKTPATEPGKLKAMRQTFVKWNFQLFPLSHSGRHGVSEYLSATFIK